MSTAFSPRRASISLAHRLAPGLGAEQADLERAGAQVHALRLGHLGNRQRVGRRRTQHTGAEVHDQRDLALGRAAGHRHHRCAQALGAVVRAQPAGEQAVAVGVVHHVARARAGRGHRARHQAGPGFDVLLGVADDGRLAGRARRGMQARQLRHRAREHAERVVVAQIGLEREGQPRDIGQGADVVRRDTRRVEP